MDEKDLEKRLRFIESMVFANPDVFQLRTKVQDLERKLEDKSREVRELKVLVEKTSDLEQKVDILHRILADLKIDVDMELYSRKNKKDTK